MRPSKFEKTFEVVLSQGLKAILDIGDEEFSNILDGIVRDLVDVPETLDEFWEQAEAMLDE